MKRPSLKANTGENGFCCNLNIDSDFLTKPFIGMMAINVIYQEQ